MQAQFRMGVVGTGLIVQESHLPACIAARGVKVTALVDSAPGRAEQVARRFRLSAGTFSSVSELKGRVDGVIIATPDQSHTTIAIECMNAGIPTLIEKPLAPTVDECMEIGEASMRSGMTVAVGYCLRFWPSVSLVAELLRRGTFGRIRRFLMQSGSQGGWSPLSSYYLHQARGAMSINGSHFLERALHWFGEPLDTRYVDDSEGGPEANARAELVYADFSGIVKVSRTMALKPMSAVETDQGILLHRDWQNPTLEFFPHGSMADPFVIAKGPCSMAGRPDPYRLQVEDFVASCRTGCPPQVGIEQGTAVTRLLGKLYACRRPMPDVWYRTTGETGGVQ